MASLTLSRPSSAETSAPNGDELAKQARRAYVVGNLEEAITGFENAYQVSGDASLLFDLAEAQREAGHSSDALTSYQNYLRRAPTGIFRKSAERQIRDLKKARPQPVAARAAAGPAVVLKPLPATKAAAAAPSPAKPQSPGSSTVAPGPVNPAPAAASAATVPAPGAGVATRSSGPVPGSGTPVTAPVSPAPRIDPVWQPDAPPPPRPLLPLPPPSAVVRPLPSAVATSEAGSPSSASSREEGKPMALAPWPVDSPPPPQTQVDLVNAPQGDPTSERVNVPRWVPVAVGVLTVALGTAAVITGLSASHRYDDLKGGCGMTPERCPDQDIDEVKSRARRANILWAATGLAAAGFGTTLYFNLRD